MILIGRRFVSVSERKSQAEAEYRYVRPRLRENRKHCGAGGEDEERGAVDRALTTVLRRWREICFSDNSNNDCFAGQRISRMDHAYHPVRAEVLDGSMTLGQVMQAASAFTIVQYAFNWLVNNYPRLAEWTASASRVSSLVVSRAALERAERGVGRIERDETAGAALRLGDLSVTLEDGTVVVKDAEVVIERGERVLVAGKSGTGKSTLVRAIAGLWPWGNGHIQVEAGAKMLLMPQRAYVPVGTLRRAVTYPLPAEDRILVEIGRVLTLVGLEHLVDRIGEDAPWDQILSGGEKQRLAFARILLHRPDIVVLDEATSALDPPSQNKMMELLTTELGATTIVSVAHRPELEAFHSRKITLERQSEGAQFVTDVDLLHIPSHDSLINRLLRPLRRTTPKAPRHNSDQRRA